LNGQTGSVTASVAWKNSTIDLVLLDLSCPIAKDSTLSAESMPVCRTVPIVVVTALDDEATAAQLMRMGRKTI
jgi:DNA-binding NarL/FixJ family response regulator